MNTLDEVNKKIGHKKGSFNPPSKFAVQTHAPTVVNWPMQRKYLSPCYTTRWDQVLKAG